VPYIKGVTHHLINSEALSKCKPNVHLLNFARGEIIDGAAVKVRAPLALPHLKTVFS